MYWLSIGPTVCKVVENQKEKVLTVPEVNTILYFPLIKPCKLDVLVSSDTSQTKSLNFQPHLQHLNLFTLEFHYCLEGVHHK